MLKGAVTWASNPAVSKAAAKRHMRQIGPESIDPMTGESSATYLAEQTAEAFDKHEWLDDPDHWIWDMAVDVSDEFGPIRMGPGR
jgi:hypothetical protein